jgi:hypothetical protein
MKKSILLLALFSGIALSACDQSPDTVLVPVPGPAGATGATGESGDAGIQGQPGESGGDTTIIIPPPVVDMPPEVVPEPSSEAPAN